MLKSALGFSIYSSVVFIYFFLITELQLIYIA